MSENQNPGLEETGSGGKKPGRPGVMVGAALGLVIGLIVGIATDSLGLWLALGIPFGMVLGNMYDGKEKRK